MKKIIISLAILLSSCSNYTEVTECKRSFILSSILQFSRDAANKDDKANVKLGMCLLSQIYTENAKNINDVYDSWEKGGNTVFETYMLKQKLYCSKDTLDIDEMFDNAVKAREFTEKHINTNCSKILNRELVTK